ncbi:Aldo-keto reductase yakc [NADP(+)] [Leucoagaricus sp. SymC.cos]|nr:Aldo-keto reductase yakc [NADP(+)] [Leucoagaricus sp. SymC.cos]
MMMLLESARIGLTGLSAFYGQVESEEERFKFLDVALENGWTFWDSASIYSGPEDLIGKWLKQTGNSNKIFLATKFGIVNTEHGR